MSSDAPVEADGAGAASAQELFREVNERTYELNRMLSTTSLDLFCECSNGCLQRLETTADQYEAVRRFPTRFLIRPEHVLSSAERVIETHPGHLVVERVARPAAPQRTLLDPRRAGVREPGPRPRLLFFFSPTSGPCRRVESFVAQVLQRRHNHDTFELVHVDVLEHREMADAYGVDSLPTLVVLEDGRVEGRLVEPRGMPAIEGFLRPWLR